MTIAITMCKLLLAMAIGFFLARKDVINEDTSVKLSYLVVNITSPLMILDSVSTVDDGDPIEVLKLFLLGVFMYLVVYHLMGRLFTKVFRIPKNLAGTYICMIMFANTSFMGFPVVQAFFGDSAIFYDMVYNMPFNILMYSIGLNFFRKDAAVETGEISEWKVDFKKFINTGTLASVAALVIFFAGISLPDPFFECIGFIGDLTPALSMIVIGASLASMSAADIKTQKGVWYMLPIRLIVMPIITWFALHLVTDDPFIIAVCTITMAMPVGAMVGMGSAPYPNQHKAASIGVALSTICCMVTIPIWGTILLNTL